jgi:hypothetical protein
MKKIMFTVALLLAGLAVTNVADASQRDSTSRTRENNSRKLDKRQHRSGHNWNSHRTGHHDKNGQNDRSRNRWKSHRTGHDYKNGQSERSENRRKTESRKSSSDTRAKEQRNGNKGVVPQNFDATRRNSELFATPSRAIKRD